MKKMYYDKGKKSLSELETVIMCEYKTRKLDIGPLSKMPSHRIDHTWCKHLMVHSIDVIASILNQRITPNHHPCPLCHKLFVSDPPLNIGSASPPKPEIDKGQISAPQLRRSTRVTKPPQRLIELKSVY